MCLASDNGRLGIENDSHMKNLCRFAADCGATKQCGKPYPHFARLLMILLAKYNENAEAVNGNVKKNTLVLLSFRKRPW